MLMRPTHSTFWTRLLACALALSFVLSCATDAEAKRRSHASRSSASRADGARSPRYADIIMNPATGEVYHAQDPDGQRYPASLTKMMTLYMLFDALEQKKISLDDDMDVSAYAAGMPQTNLALSKGDEIDVETAIKALVVRSANDVAVVIAEKLGGDVDHFAVMMTAKARQLGMKNTVFKNPNGLPNPNQHTTARDMAKLGIALKRDFPKYYPYFSTLQFSHNGVTYYTHNRVMLRYAGVDGIKTGYIGLSGFNLVTSVVRGGRPLVGAVMGGSSGRWRDDRMIALLDDAYKTVAKRGGVKGQMYPGNLPLAKLGSSKIGIDMDETALASADGLVTSGDVNPKAEDGQAEGEDETATESSAPKPAAPEAKDAKTVGGQSPFETAERAAVETRGTRMADGDKTPAAAKAPYVAARTVALAPDSSAPQPKAQAGIGKTVQLKAVTKPAAKQEAKAATKTKLRDAANPPAAMGDRVWGIQVGAYSSLDQASLSMKNALQLAPKPLAEAHLATIAPPNAGANTVYRARLDNLTQIEAKKACEVLISNNSPCFIYSATP